MQTITIVLKEILDIITETRDQNNANLTTKMYELSLQNREMKGTTNKDNIL